MSLASIPNVPDSSLPTHEELSALASTAGLVIPEQHVEGFRTLLGALDQCAKVVMDMEDYVPKVDYQRYPRTDIHVPEDSDKGGWATKVTAKSTAPTGDLLKGRTVALKDNVGLAGVRCTNGSAAMEWTPEIDATIVSRILDAGGVITGKSACENSCLGGSISDTAVTGPVHNPFADGYSTGGSSSGSGRLVATGSVDMAIGCDQGGSIRIPANHCGVVGLKPTWGLVPYTGIVSLEATIDHAGPMTKNVRDCALLLEAISGADGLDDRQPVDLKAGSIKFAEDLDKALTGKLESELLKGVKIGILEEGFGCAAQNPNSEKAVRDAIEKFKALGADVGSCSIPLHAEAGTIWMVSMPIAGMRQGLLGDMTGRKQLYLTDRAAKVGPRLTQASFDALGSGGQNVYLRGLFLEQKYGAQLHARSTNLLRKVNDAYDKALKEYDVLVMPTSPLPPKKLFYPRADVGPMERLSRTVGYTYNTASFNSTGHPALSVPVGFVPAEDDPAVKLPQGLQIVGRKFEDAVCMRVAGAWERAYDWRQVVIG